MVTKDQLQDLQELIRQTPAPHLADCLELIPAENLQALADMVEEARNRHVQHAVYRYQLLQDVAKLTEGHIDCNLFSHPFLQTAIQ